MRHFLVDVFEENEEIVIYANFSGVRENSVSIDVGQVGLDCLMFIFGKNLEGRDVVIQTLLPRGIDIRSGNWVWRNGVIEIRFKKLRQRK